MSLKEDVQEEKQRRNEEWQQEIDKAMASENKKRMFILAFVIVIIGILVLPWLRWTLIANGLEILLAVPFLTGYPLAYIFGKHGMNRLASVILSLIIGIVILILVNVYIWILVPSILG